MADSDSELQEDILKWSIRYVLIPVSLAVLAGYFALAVVDRQFEHQSKLPGNDPYAGIFATMTAAAANSQPTPNPAPTNTPPADPTATEKANQDDKDVASTTEAIEPPASSNNGSCGQVPAGWRLYTVQPGNTLFSLARQTGTTIAAIQQANCLYGQLLAYSQIWLPDVFVEKEEPIVEITRIVEPIITVTPTITVTVPAPLPDLINGASGLACLGDDACVPTFNYTVANVGPGSAGAFNIQLQFFSKAVVPLNQFVAGLEPGEVQTFSLTNELISSCYYMGCNFCITVDSSSEITEENEENNRYCPVVEGRG